MTTNKQDKLARYTSHTIDDVVHDALEEGFCGDCEHPRCLNKVNLYTTAINDLINSEVLSVLDELENQAKDIGFGNGVMLPISAIQTQKAKYQN